jgi:hypothetical protein
MSSTQLVGVHLGVVVQDAALVELGLLERLVVASVK